MPVEVWTNDGLGTVTAGGTTAPAAGTVETWTVTATNAFPVAATGAGPATQFYVADQNSSFATEKILVTVAPGGAGAGQTWTVTRGADGTTPLAHTASFTIVQVVARSSLWALAGIPPSGDVSGVTDSANIVAAFAGGAQRVLLQAGTFNVTQGQVVLGYGQYLAGAGKSSTIIKLVGGVAGPAVTIFSAGSSTTKFGGCRDLTIDGTSAAANSTGLQCGDISEVALWDVACNNFGGGSGIGFSFINQNSWTEQLHGSIYSVNCDTCVQFSVSGTGTNSFERLSLDMWLGPNAGGSMVVMKNNSLILHGRLAIRGNQLGAGGSCLSFPVGSTAGISYSQLDIAVENDATSGIGATTISFTASSVIQFCYGVISFALGGGAVAWTASNATGQNFLGFNGLVNGDAALSGVTTPALNANFAAFGSGYASPGYQYEAVMGGRVRLTGMVSLTANQIAGAAIFTLPGNLKPAFNHLFTTAGTLSGGSTAGTIEVTSAGVVQIFPAGSTGNYVSLDGITFPLN